MSLETVLVTGGCGLVGFHVVQQLLQNHQQWDSIHVMSRNPCTNLLPGVHYHAGSVSSREQVRNILNETQPTVIVHTASPQGAASNLNDRAFLEANVKGTQNLLESAVESRRVKAFVYTSSMGVIEGSSHSYVDESVPIKSVKTRPAVNEYDLSKAIADQLVLDYNGRGGMKTASLRVASVYGERDNQLVPALLDSMRQGQHKVQIGDDTAPYDFVSADNVAKAHLLTIEKLLNRTANGVEGEAFFITDGHAIPFQTFARKVYAAAGDTTAPGDIQKIPAWLILNLASLVEWMYWLFTFGQLKPVTFTRQTLQVLCTERTLAIDKARQRLGYSPDLNMDQGIKDAVSWNMKQTEQREGTPQGRTGS